MDIIFDIPASVKSLKNYVTGSRKTFNDKVHLFFLTPLKWAIHAFVNVFLSGIHSRLEQDLRIYLSPWHVSPLLLSFLLYPLLSFPLYPLLSSSLPLLPPLLLSLPLYPLLSSSLSLSIPSSPPLFPSPSPPLLLSLSLHISLSLSLHPPLSSSPSLSLSSSPSLSLSSSPSLSLSIHSHTHTHFTASSQEH